MNTIAATALQMILNRNSQYDVRKYLDQLSAEQLKQLAGASAKLTAWALEDAKIKDSLTNSFKELANP